MTKISDALNGVKRLGLDTMSVIYFVEENPSYVAVVDPVFQKISDGSLIGIVSSITLIEVLVLPLRIGKKDLADQYRDLLTGSDNLEVFALDSVIAETAAGLRARHNLRTPDAAVIATAIEAGCDAVLTNDDKTSRVTEIRIISLDDLEP